jgi:hypothetical protein
MIEAATRVIGKTIGKNQIGNNVKAKEVADGNVNML